MTAFQARRASGPAPAARRRGVISRIGDAAAQAPRAGAAGYASEALGRDPRNIRTIEVLLDRDAVTTGAAANGQPWQHYDLGHGYCFYSFFEQCPHRMAFARCYFCTPKGSSQAQLLEAHGNLQRMLHGPAGAKEPR